VLKQYTVAERDLQVGRVSSDTPGLTDLVLGYQRELVAKGNEGEVRPFQVEGQVLRPAADGVFALFGTVYALSQAYGAGVDYRVRFTLVGAGPDRETLDEWEFALARYQGGGIEESFPLDAIDTAGNYELHLALLEPGGAVVAERSSPLAVSPRTAVTRAGYLSREGFNGAAPGLLSLERAEQLLALGRYDEGVAELENAVAADNPDLPMARWKLAAIRIASGDAERTLELLTPLEASYPNQFEVTAGLGFAYYTKQEFDKGQSYLEKAVSLRPPYPALLNALADCYERTGQTELALETFERSLALESNQPVVAERVSGLRSPH
jgi:tetratricopeptide (TPR) repeat protein